MKTPTVLLILDGYGLAPASEGNAISLASKMNINTLLFSCPSCLLQASGEDVGLPAGTMGNSEVGHTNIGAGRVVYQSLLRINNAIADGSYFENPAYVEAAEALAGTDAAAHLLILLSDEGVHSSLSHLWAMLKLLRDKGVKNVYLHCFMDGRDSPPTSGEGFIAQTLDKLAELGVGKIATLGGRFYGMDRDKRWERVKTAYDAMVLGDAPFDPDPLHAVRESYAAGKTDEFIVPVVCDRGGLVKPGDTIFFINFRPDRARELTRAFAEPGFDGFTRDYFPVSFVCATEYDADIKNVTVAFPPEVVKNTIGEYISSLGMTQMHIAETEKYAHVTFFLNGGREEPFPGEKRILIPSPREYPTYDLVPEMSARQVTRAACDSIAAGVFDLIVVNLANCDMVGHTGNIPAVVEAVEVVDECVGSIARATENAGGICIVTADHGNADEMLDENGNPHTAHTTNPVPFIISGADVSLHNGRLADIAPTILDLLGLAKPEEMTGASLIDR
jgi:2,3-bisphosphoglycerate-independent phosphoglycerate mutase